MFPFDLSVGEWGAAPTSGNYRLQDVFGVNPGGVQTGIMDGQGSAAYDSLRKEMVIGASGGHALCADNSVFAYSYDPLSAYFLQWRRKTYPSTRSDGASVITYPDGSPSARHIYSSWLYLAHLDKFILMPGGVRWGTTPIQGAEIFLFDATTETPNTSQGDPGAWERMTDPASFPSAGSPAGPAPQCVYDPDRELVVQFNSRGVSTYDPDTDTYTNQTSWDYINADFNYTSLYVPGGVGHMLLVGNGYTQAKRLDTYAQSANSTSISDYGLTGDTAIKDAAGPGLAYDANSNKVIGWSGTLSGGTNNGDYYEIDFDTKVSVRRSGTGDIPTNPNSNYTNGRLMSIGDGVLALVNRTSETMYFLRVSEPQSTPSLPRNRMNRILPLLQM